MPNKGFVYIFTNPCLEGWVKIGMTEEDDIGKRLEQLNKPTNLPLSFRSYAYYEVDNPGAVEKSIHRIIDAIDDSRHARELQASGRIREREFFQISAEQAFTVFQELARHAGNLDKLHLQETTLQEQEEEMVASRRKNFTFKMLQIPVGSMLTFIKDDTITCEVIDQKNTVKFQEQTYSLSSLALKMLIEICSWPQNSSVAGPKYFTYENEVLSDRRFRLENEGAIDIEYV